MKESEKTYKKGLKGIAIFGGLQIYKILLSIITTKVSAVFLGPFGSGIYGLISSTLVTTEAVVSCGLGTSAVKDISMAKASGNEEEIAFTYTTLNWLVWITGLIGTVAIIICAPQLSELTFGNTDFTSWFRILSVTVLINQLQSGQGAL
ncbi:MAG: oligosaccharide flippase family protein, partial [Muribaculaceae bacterium]|nr:oligosaccharide flippase family protein [Muribaculaceae bacterium]